MSPADRLLYPKSPPHSPSGGLKPRTPSEDNGFHKPKISTTQAFDALIVSLGEWGETDGDS